MNRLLTFSGGQPFTTEDLSFLQNIFKDTVEAIVKSLVGNIDCILTGIQGSYTSAKPGAVYIGGNIYVLTSAISGGGSKYYLCINQKETGQRMFRDSLNHNVYLVDDAYMSESPSSVSIDLRSANTLSEIIVNGKGLWESIGPLLNTEGEVLVPKDAGIATRASMLVSIVKPQATETNQLWSTDFRDPYEYRGITVFGNQAYIVVGSKNEGRVYNMDGSEYNGPITINNLELK